MEIPNGEKPKNYMLGLCSIVSLVLNWSFDAWFILRIIVIMFVVFS